MNKLFLTLIVIPLFSISFCSKEDIPTSVINSEWKYTPEPNLVSEVDYHLIKFLDESRAEFWSKNVDSNLEMVSEGSYTIAKINEGGLVLDGITFIFNSMTEPIVGTFVTSKRMTLIIERETYTFKKQ